MLKFEKTSYFHGLANTKYRSFINSAHLRRTESVKRVENSVEIVVLTWFFLKLFGYFRSIINCILSIYYRKLNSVPATVY